MKEYFRDFRNDCSHYRSFCDLTGDGCYEEGCPLQDELKKHKESELLWNR